MPRPRKPDPARTDADAAPDATAHRAPRSALQQGVALLARREYAQRELRQRLLARGHDAAETTAALAALAVRQYQSDTRYAQSLARTRAAQGYGPRRIRSELSAQGVSRDEIERAIEALNHDWQASADAQLRRHGTGRADAAARARAAQWLLRRGFDAATVRCATRTALDDAAEED